MYSLFFDIYINLIASRCDSGWEFHEEKCYKIFYPASPSTAPQTNGLCKRDGAVAASIRSQEENDWIAKYSLEQMTKDGKYPGLDWLVLGVKKGADGKLAWESADTEKACPVTFTKWAPGEPLGGFAIYMTVKARNKNWKPGDWNDIPDTEKQMYPAVCVKPAKNASPKVVDCDYKKEDNPPPRPSCQCNNRCSSCGCGCGCRCGCGCGCGC